MAEDPFLRFISSVSDKIKIEKEHKNMMEKINSSEEPIEKSDPLQAAIEILKKKIEEKQNVEDAVPSNEIQVQSENVPLASEPVTEEKDSFGEFLFNLKDILAGKQIDKTQIVSAIKQEQTDTPAEISQDVVDKDSTEETSAEENEKKSYVDILDQLSNEPAAKREPEKVNEIRSLIEQYADKYFKKAAIMSEYAGGGGTNAVQFSNGGVMNGDLNVNGNILSGGNNLLDLFSGGGGGGGGGDPAVNTVVYTGSANWNNTYTTVNSYSATWSTGLQDLNFNESTYDLSITNGNTVNLSALKDNLSEIASTSAYWADTRNNVTFEQDVTIQGNLTALGSSTFKNTIFTTSSALSVVNTGPGPALYVYQAAGPYDVASFYDGDGIEVLHVGNANAGQGGKVGINESFPTVELTVNGKISANEDITVLGGNSNQWNSNYAVFNANSGNYESAYSNLVSNSATYLGTTRQYDYVQDSLNSYSYCGYAIPGTLTSSIGWTINRLFFSSAGTLLSSGAVTSAIWDNRYSYTY